MIKNAIYKVRKGHYPEYNLLECDKVIILSKDLYRSVETVLPPGEGSKHDRKMVNYYYAYTYESWKDGKRTIAEMTELQFTDSIYSSYDFVGFVGEQ
tara:strand:+ start:499 stop:789 length:291 start_codon:yes stop_codon:yes gene_type:complete